MTFLTTSIPHDMYRRFRTDEQCHHDEMLMSFDICRSSVLPSEAKIVDRSDRVALPQAVAQELFGAR